MIVGKNVEVLASELDLGAAPCNHCKQIHVLDTRSNDRRKPTPKYLYGGLGAITLNPVWVKNQEIPARYVP